MNQSHCLACEFRTARSLCEKACIEKVQGQQHDINTGISTVRHTTIRVGWPSAARAANDTQNTSSLVLGASSRQAGRQAAVSQQTHSPKRACRYV
mmetsp:Transcript_43300/g.108176  ORF Transcript_43300/g.108176 Transcript_43300/m.108176 type:complete len:95 (+) Transcript_43300:541-825(+)